MDMKTLQKTTDEVVLLPGARVSGDVTIGRGCSIWYNAVLRGDEDPIILGENTNVQDNAVLHTTTGTALIVGSGVTIGHGAILHSCTVGDNTLIGMGSIVLDGAAVGRDCVIGAGAVVTGGTVIPDGSMAFGSPARVVRALREDEIEHNRTSALAYAKRKEKYR